MVNFIQVRKAINDFTHEHPKVCSLLLYLILLAAGIGMRLVVKRKRDFGVLAGESAGLWIVCEILVDIGSVREMPLGLFSAAYTVGSVCFCFAVGFLLCSLVCRLLHRRCII